VTPSFAHIHSVLAVIDVLGPSTCHGVGCADTQAECSSLCRGIEFDVWALSSLPFSGWTVDNCAAINQSKAVSGMRRLFLFTAIFVVQLTLTASAERIKRKPPNEKEVARIASEQALNDGNLQKGDIVSTDRGFFEFRGVAQDGSFDFVPIPNPLSPKKKDGASVR
jgi:hypothetical protein